MAGTRLMTTGEEPTDPQAEEPARPARTRKRRRRGLVVLAIVVLLFAAVTARFFVWPDLPALPDRADAIIELGGPGFRDDAALALAREHRAGVLVQSTVEQEAGTDRCLPPVPDVTILCFHADPPTTQGEARAIGELAARSHWNSVILVTTPDHAWRARLWVSRCFPGQIYVSTSPLPPLYWFRQIPYQWGATTKALLFERDC
jgi:uncharacterized SAM-binding protein YcdF (DUF218 family)